MHPYLLDIQQSSIESFLRAIYLAENIKNSSKIPFISIDLRPETVSQRQIFFFFFPLPRRKSIDSLKALVYFLLPPGPAPFSHCVISCCSHY